MPTLADTACQSGTCTSPLTGSPVFATSGRPSPLAAQGNGQRQAPLHGGSE